ncbi:MAG: hypothetical protein IJE89_05705 [Bacilli bacterium]|nr:hypothetical protein [Bacilli bacterium]
MGEEYIKLSTEQYTIYKNNGYYLCISDLQQDSYDLIIGFSDKDISTLSKEEIINEIRKIGDLINSLNQKGIYVLPIISPYELEQAALENDDRLFNQIMVTKIKPITRDIYERLSRQNKNLEAVIKMIKQTDADRKFIDWLDMKLMTTSFDYIDDIEYKKLKEALKEKEVNETYIQTASQYSFQGIPPIDRTYENQTKNNRLVKRLVKPNTPTSPGFSNISFITITLTIALILGIGISYLIIK